MEQHSTTIDTNGQAAFRRLLDGWLTTWNGDYSLANTIISPDFHVHAAPLGGGDRTVEGPDGLVEWIAQTRAAFTELVFTVEVGPIVDRDHLALRWIAVGTYGGGFPGATAPAGTAIRFTGIDILRIEQDEIAEYWVNSDMHVLLATLGVHA
ncbi:ester cyclase [Nocardia sp. NPDC050175]|uniref:ester cyclase n=1 Tax=Nocardia sp. NPDC050175 TaxID=3364317 RepID=UPI00378A7B60